MSPTQASARRGQSSLLRFWLRFVRNDAAVLAAYSALTLFLACMVLWTDGRLSYVWVFLMVPVLLSGLLESPRIYRLELLMFGLASLALISRHLQWDVFVHGAAVWGANLTAVALATEFIYRLANARRTVEEALRRSERRYRLLFERNLAGVFRATEQGRFLDCNPSYANLMGFIGPAEVLRRCAQDFTLAPGTWEGLVAELRQVKVISNRELRYRKADGSLGWAIQNLSLMDEGTDAEAVEGSLIDITERKEAEDALRDLATRDGLTGLHNRRELDRMLAEEFERAQRYHRPLALVMLDIDHFKRINDEFGHLVGDQVLRWVSAKLEAQLRATDRAARYGGEEFLMVLPETSPAEALAVAERFRTELCAHPFVMHPPDGDPISLRVTVSLGVAGLDRRAIGSESILEHADRALYEAKREGRNRAVLRMESKPMRVQTLES